MTIEKLNKSAAESAYCFFHQKRQVYLYSQLDWQKDDIEIAIADYVEQMSEALYNELAQGKKDYLVDHQSFADDLNDAVMKLEKLI